MNFLRVGLVSACILLGLFLFLPQIVMMVDHVGHRVALIISPETLENRKVMEEEMIDSLISDFESYAIKSPIILSHDSIIRIGDEKMSKLKDSQKLPETFKVELENAEKFMEQKFSRRNQIVSSPMENAIVYRSQINDGDNTPYVFDRDLYLHIVDGAYDIRLESSKDPQRWVSK